MFEQLVDALARALQQLFIELAADDEGVPQHPLEHAPARDQLDQRAELLVEIFFLADVGIAPADVGGEQRASGTLPRARWP